MLQSGDRRQIIDESRPAGQERRILLARDRRADPTFRDSSCGVHARLPDRAGQLAQVYDLPSKNSKRRLESPTEWLA